MALISSNKGTYTGTIAECLARHRDLQGTYPDLKVGEMTLRIGDEDPIKRRWSVEDCEVRKAGLVGCVLWISDEEVCVAWEDASRNVYDVDVLTDGTLEPL